MTRIRVTLIAASAAALAATALTVERGLADDPEASLARVSPDRRFRGDGRALARLGFDVIDHVRVDAAGRIVVAGAKRTLGEIDTGIDVYAPLVARLLPGGRVDRSFGQGGVVQVAALGRPTGLVLGPSHLGEDKIAVVGDFVDPAQRRITAVRLLPGGVPDTSFADGIGFESTAATIGTWRLPTRDPATGALTVVAGETAPSRIVRLTDSGVLDDAYGSGGVVVTEGFVVLALAVDADGRVVVARSAPTDPREPQAPDTAEVVRLGADGTPDAAFGGDGRLRGPHGSVISARTLRFDAAGRLVVRGQEFGHLFGFFRFLSDGTLDASFSEDGFAAELNGIPGGAERAEGAFGIAAGAGGSYVTSGDLTFYDRTLSHPLASGYFVQSVDPANPTAVRSLVVRDRSPITRARTEVRTAAISEDGSSVVVAGYEILTAKRHQRTLPVIFRVDLSESAPVALPDARIARVAATAETAPDGSFRLAIDLDLANDGAGAWANGSVVFHLSGDDILDAADVPLGSWSTGRVAGGRTARVRIQTGWFSFGEVLSLAGRRVLAELNPFGTVMEVGGANAVAAAPMFE